LIQICRFLPVLGPVVVTASMLQGCAPPATPVSTTRLYYIDQQGGAASCQVAPVTLADGKEAAGTISVANDGGWCAISVAAGNRPYAAGLLTQPPAHGKVYVHTVGDATRIDYTPDVGFTGADTYVVKFLPGAPTLRVAVTVTPGPASVVATPPTPVPAPTPPKRTRSQRGASSILQGRGGEVAVG
jgi:hypothetical protein